MPTLVRHLRVESCIVVESGHMDLGEAQADVHPQPDVPARLAVTASMKPSQRRVGREM